MSGDGFHHQNELFYCSHWTREIEKCFVDSLLDHHRNGSFHRERNNCHAVLCAAFDINSAFGSELSYSYCQRRMTKLKIRYCVFRWIIGLAAVKWEPERNAISADDDVWDQIKKARKIGQVYVNAPEPHWNALVVLFGEDWADEKLEDECEFFDRGGTCSDDVWVHDIPPHEEDSDSYESWISHDDSEGESSWLAFVHEYYASDSDPSSVNMSNSHSRRPPPELYYSPPALSTQRSTQTPSSCASNDPDGKDCDPSPSTVPKKP